MAYLVALALATSGLQHKISRTMPDDIYHGWVKR
jgi:hypothetical protein